MIILGLIQPGLSETFLFLEHISKDFSQVQIVIFICKPEKHSVYFMFKSYGSFFICLLNSVKLILYLMVQNWNNDAIIHVL